MNKLVTSYKLQVTKGFTLLELLVVIGIIGILVAMGTVSYTTAQSKSRDSRRKGDLENISKALEQYYAKTYSYPADANCVGYEAYLASSKPVDPKWGFAYTDSTANIKSGGSGAFCSDLSFCICIEMETPGTGNASGRSGAACSFGGTENYFCVQNQQ